MLGRSCIILTSVLSMMKLKRCCTVMMDFFQEVTQNDNVVDDNGDHNDDNDDDDIIIRIHSIPRLYVILIISYKESHYFLLYYL